MGEVYLASAQGAAGFEKLVTAKILRRHISASTERVTGLLREAFIGVRLDHENIVQVLDLDEHEGTFFIVMEYVRGFSLRELVAAATARGESLPIRPVVHVVRCIADALEYVHRVRGPQKRPLGLIHRDVSPSNILLGAEGRIKLSDFGVAAVARDAARPGTVIGKPSYLPPEARHGEAATQGWDIYALGVVLHGALAGDPGGEQGTTTIAPRLRPIGELRGDCAALAPVIERLTARDPQTRVHTAAELRDLLEAAVPRQADDIAMWRDYIQTAYRHEAFVSRYGLLPHVEDLVPELDPEPAPPSAVAYVETVVVDAARPIRFGMSPALGVEIARMQGERLATWLRRRLDREVRSVVFGDYRALVDAIVEGEVDFAWMPPVPLVHAADRGAGVVALAERYGRPSYESAIIVREGTPLSSLADLVGRSIAFVDRDSAGGYLYALDLVTRTLGLPADVLGEQHFQGSHRAVCEAVARGWVDAGATYAVRDRDDRVVHAGWLDLIGSDGAKLRPLAYTGPIPGDAIAHRPGLAVGLVERLATTVVDLDPTDAEGVALLADVFHSNGMLRADLRIYDPVRAILGRRDRQAA